MNDFAYMKKREEEMRDTNGKDNDQFPGKDLERKLRRLLLYFVMQKVKLADLFLLSPESTNTRVLYFSIFSMCCLIGLATWQVFYLRRFFKAKKLIE